jgi:hypothetical protein
MSVASSSGSSSVSLWEDLELESLLEEGRKSLGTVAATAMLMAAKTKNKKVLSKHRNMLAKPGFNVLMNRYGAVPHAPIGIASEDIVRLADPILGRFASYAKYEEVMKDEVGTSAGSPMSKSSDKSSSRSPKKDSSSSSVFLTGAGSDDDDDNYSDITASTVHTGDNLTVRIKARDKKIEAYEKVKGILEKPGRNYISNIFKELRTTSVATRKKIANSSVLQAKAVPKHRLVHPSDELNRKLALKLNVNYRTKFKLRKLPASPQEREMKQQWNDRACHNPNDKKRMTPLAVYKMGKPRPILTMKDIQEIRDNPEAANKIKNNKQIIPPIQLLLSTHGDEDESFHTTATTPSTRSIPNSGNRKTSTNGPILPPLPAYSSPIKKPGNSSTNRVDGAPKTRKSPSKAAGVVDAQLNKNIGLALLESLDRVDDSSSKKMSFERKLSNIIESVDDPSPISRKLSPLKRQNSNSFSLSRQNSFGRQESDRFDPHDTIHALGRQPSLRRSNSKISPAEFAHMRKNSYDFTQFDLEHNLTISKQASVRQRKKDKFCDIHVNKHDHGSRHAPWLLGTNTDIDYTHKTAKDYADKHLVELRKTSLEEAIHSLITPRSHEYYNGSVDENSTDTHKLSAFHISVALADAILEEAQAVNNLVLQKKTPAAQVTTSELIHSIDGRTLDDAINFMAHHSGRTAASTNGFEAGAESFHAGDHQMTMTPIPASILLGPIRISPTSHASPMTPQSFGAGAVAAGNDISTPRSSRRLSSTKALFTSLKLRSGVDDALMARIERLAQRVEEHINLADFDPALYAIQSQKAMQNSVPVDASASTDDVEANDQQAED